MAVHPTEVPRVAATPATRDALARLREEHGPVILYQSGGCCGGSVPMCLEEGELRLGDHDVLLGRVGECPVYIDDRQFQVWKHTQLIIDVGDGEPEELSLPADGDRHFVTKARVFSPEELQVLDEAERAQPGR